MSSKCSDMIALGIKLKQYFTTEVKGKDAWAKIMVEK